MSYSTGSSVVTSLSAISFISDNAEYSVVVLPEPVGPVTSTMPFGRLMIRRKFSLVVSSMPTLSSDKFTTERSKIRMTTLSPNIVGKTLTRRSIG